jgi:hypothetical protein
MQQSAVIYFMTPDIRGPSGGVRVIYEYAYTLSQAGIPASVWHGEDGFRLDHHHPAPVVSGEVLSIKRRDVLVVPEVRSQNWSTGTLGIPKVVLNQNHFLTLSGMPEGSALHRPYVASPDVVAAIATSRAIDAFLRLMCPELPTHFCPVSVDTHLFQPAAAKENLIAWMPRKRATELRLVTETLRRRGTMTGWKFLPLDGVPPSQGADALGRARIFLLGNESEGLGLPGLEALASGCHVIGFHGGGGKEYADYPLCTPIDDGDIIGMVEIVERIARQEPQPSIADVTKTRDLIERDHGRSLCDGRMVQIFRELTADGSPALVQRPIPAQHNEYEAIQSRRSLRWRAGATLRRIGLRK